MQEKVDALIETAQRAGYKISKEKTKVQRNNNIQQDPIVIEGRAIEDVLRIEE
uniref:Uncharacterized protein n=1 Tax=Arion vulgaris TaxID=1028688 RepID=A0A0B6YAW1_9EUPU